MKNTKVEDLCPQRIDGITQYKHARGYGGEFWVLSVNPKNRTFTGKNCNTGQTFENLNIDEYYFFEFV